MTHYTVVTGANRGLGKALALHLAQAGHPVVVTARDRATAEALADTIRATGTKAIGEALDIADENSVRLFGDRLRTQAIGVSTLVNNAGVYIRDGSLDAPTRTLATNVFGTLHVIGAVLPLLPTGRIVNVSSALGKLRGYAPAIEARFRACKTRDDVVALAHDYLSAAKTYDLAEKAGYPRDPYSVSKALLNALTRVLATELAPRTVVAVSPGWVKTDMGGVEAPRALSEGVASLAHATLAPVTTGHFYFDGTDQPY